MKNEKEKAEDLVRKMCLNDCTDKNIKQAKRYALIAANEIWRALESARVFEEYDHWQKVKTEIEKL